MGGRKTDEPGSVEVRGLGRERRPSRRAPFVCVGDGAPLNGGGEGKGEGNSKGPTQRKARWVGHPARQQALVQTVLQNGSATSPTHGTTQAMAISYSIPSSPSYSTMNLLSTMTGNATTSSIVGDNTPYVQSALSSRLAFPTQTAIIPPVLSSTNADLVAVATGTSFAISTIGTGKVLISGTVPYPIRGISLTSTKLFFTMGESNSLVTLPVTLPTAPY